MTFLEAARVVLADAGKPLHYEAIFQRAVALGLIESQGATPGVTMASRLYTVTKQDGSIFERHGKGIFGLARKKRSGVEALVAETNQRTRTQLHDLLAQVPPKRFEALIMDLLLEMGFDEKTLAVTPFVKDGGIDVVGTYSAAGLAPVNAAVQVKRWKGNIQSQTVTQLRGSLQVHQFGIIITTSDFTKGARQESEAPGKTRISLINGEQLISLLIRHHVGVVDQPLVVTQLDTEWWGELLSEHVLECETQNLEESITPQEAQCAARAQKPIAVTILGTTNAVNTWKSALMALVVEMAVRHPSEFADVAPTIRGRKRCHISASPEAMIAPEAINGTGFWLETNQSAKSVIATGEKILEAFGHSAQDFQIHVA
jgi:restriction system protein